MPKSTFGNGRVGRDIPLKPHESYNSEEEAYEENKRTMGFPSGGYLIGRHPECGKEFAVMPTAKLEANRAFLRPSITITYDFESSLPDL